MDLAVAIQAAPVNDERRWPTAGQTVRRIGHTRVPARRMTGLAQQRGPLDQHRLMD